jgi:hypothetical protein
MSENLLKYFAGPIETVVGAERLALRLFLDIERHHGEDEARRIFARWGKEPTKNEIAEAKTFKVLDRYDNMLPEPNVMALARELAAENISLPPADQITARGSTTAATIEHHIRDLLRRRKAAVAAGTWQGPPWFD